MPRQHDRHCADDTFKRNENVWIPMKISLKFVPKGSINNIPALFQIMDWRRSGDKPLSEPMIVYRRIYASLGLNEITIGKSYRLKIFEFTIYLIECFWGSVTTGFDNGIANKAFIMPVNIWFFYGSLYQTWLISEVLLYVAIYRRPFYLLINFMGHH